MQYLIHELILTKVQRLNQTFCCLFPFYLRHILRENRRNGETACEFNPIVESFKTISRYRKGHLRLTLQNMTYLLIYIY